MKKNIPNGLFIHNEWVHPTDCELIEDINPSDESVICEAICAGEQQVDDAVKSCRRALNGEWRSMNPWDRGRLLMKISELVTRDLDILAEMEMKETGKPKDAAYGAIRQVSRYFEFYAGVADKIQGVSIPLEEKYIDFTLREPIGITAHIVPWNAPLNMLARGVAPAMAAGCASVVKPAEQTPIGALQLAEIFKEAGVPAGVMNVINGYGAKTGSWLSSHPEIDALVFTGSMKTGSAVMKACAEHITPVVLELGGKSPLLVFDDVSPLTVAQEAVKGIYSNTGQYCDAGSRLLLSKNIHDAVLEELLKITAKISVGIPDDNPDMGPLISAAQQKTVNSFIERGISEGAKLVSGGKFPANLDKGYFIEPTVFTEVEPSHEIANKEIFGPVLSVMSFDDEEEALEIANGTEYGLAAGVFTKDINRAMRLIKRLDAGSVHVNEYFSGEMAAPFGGVKKSGIGREKGLETLANYTRIKNVIIHIAGI